MATFSKEFLSGSTNGRPVKIAAIATPGTTIHTAHATSKDEVHIYAVNTSATAVKVTIEFGGVTAPDDLIEATIPPEAGPQLLIPGFPVSGSVLVKAFAATADVVTLAGFVNRITP